MKIKSTHTGISKEVVLIALLVLAMAILFVLSVKKKHSQPNEEQLANVSDVKSVAANFEETTLDISINNDGFEKLSQKRKEALETGLLFSSKDDLVDADIKINGEEYACKLRLKGDLLDHLRGDNWSFRVILKDGKEWKGMKTFSIHNSMARSHTAEWLMHELFRQEGIIVPGYDFVKTKINGVDQGVYAFEHHFENQMLRKNERAIGPILKHNDDAYWDNVLKNLKPFPWIEASPVEVFNKNNMTDPAFGELAKRSIGMLDDFLKDRKSVSEVFDVEQMAKYYALLDLSHAWHAQQFTNIRFYHNPTSGKLEPIAFDCFGDHLPNVNKDWEALGEGFNGGVSKESVFERGNVYRYHLLQDKGFFNAYMKYLNQFTNPQYLIDFKTKMAAALEVRAKFIQSDEKYKDFKPNFDKLFAKADFTNKKLLPKSNLSLKAYRINDSKQEIELKSFHYFPMEVLGFGSEMVMAETLEQPLFLEAYNAKIPMKSYRLKAKSPIEYIYYRTLGIDQVFKLKLPKSSAPEKDLPTVKSDLASLVALPFVSQLGNQISIASGKHAIQKDLVVPAGYELMISPGTELQFVNGGSLCSYSAIKAVGSLERPIIFTSTGGQGSGILISEVSEDSNFEHCQFVRLSAYKHQNIITNGGLNIYKSSVDFNHCDFIGIKAGEAISIRNSKVVVSNTNVKDVQGTAIKSSYASLHLNQVSLEGVGKNGLSIAAGNCEANNLVVRGVLNKALNFTSNAKVYMNKVDIYDSYQSFYANEHSQVTMVRFWNENIERGIEVRSSQEPHTKVELSQFNHQNVNSLFLIKQGISVMVNGKKERAK